MDKVKVVPNVKYTTTVDPSIRRIGGGFKTMTYAKVFLIACGGCATILFAQTPKPVPYPEGFRNWTHVKTGFGPQEGIHNIYANEKAMEGFRTGRFVNGSVFVFDVLDTETKSGVVSVGERRVVDVMHKDGGRFVKTGGWGFEEFNGSSRTGGKLDEITATGCFNCHAGQKQHDYVFSSFRE